MTDSNETQGKDTLAHLAELALAAIPALTYLAQFDSFLRTYLCVVGFALSEAIAATYARRNPAKGSTPSL